MQPLIASATPWISDEVPKKRTPSIRKTIKKKNIDDEPDYNKLKPSSIEDLQNISNDRSDRVNDLLNQMSSADQYSDSSTLADFTPISPPRIQTKKDMQNIEYSDEYNALFNIGNVQYI